MRTVRVEASSAYDVLIGPGLLGECGARIAKVIAPCTAALVSDSNVAPLYAARVRESLETAGFRVAEFRFPAGERSKNLDVWAETISFLAENRLGRGDFVAALGGGVTGDLAGFAASAYQRGIRCVQLPTTLLSAVDSSVGGKTAVDLPQGKNLVGSFHQPSLVLCDTDTLATLPDVQLRSGCAEAIKCAVLSSEELFARMETVPIPDMLEDTITACVEYKRGVVARDEFDTGERAFLNLGHTVGHAVEKCGGYALTHGEAVAVGLAVVTRAAAARGICSPRAAERIVALLEKTGLPVTTDIGATELFEAALSDKKRRGDSIRLILPEEIGRCRIEPVPAADLIGWMRDGGVR